MKLSVKKRALPPRLDQTSVQALAPKSIPAMNTKPIGVFEIRILIKIRSPFPNQQYIYSSRQRPKRIEINCFRNVSA